MTKKWYPQRKTIDAPIATIKTFIHHIGHPISRATIEKDIESHREFPSLSFEAITEILKDWGMEPIAYKANLESLPSLPIPSITLIEEIDKRQQMGIPVLFFGLEQDTVTYVHPRKGWVYESLADFNAKWSKAMISLTGITSEGEEDFEELEKEYIQKLENHPERQLVQSMDQVLTADECDHIIAISNDRFARSKVGGIEEAIYGRTSYSAYLVIDDDQKLNAIREKIAQRINRPTSHFEYFQCVSYALGQEYQNHYDTFDPETEDGRLTIEADGQRKFTLLIYLSDDFEGGQTHFPKLDLLVTPEKGGAVLFQNIDDDGKLIDSSFHSGLPISRGKKYALNLWIRERAIKEVVAS
ncbi:MAG: prolyl 4-hydroxylase [Flavobacteriaceae bacterium]|jgi:prolyl 4-hydroxylase